MPTPFAACAMMTTITMIGRGNRGGTIKTRKMIGRDEKGLPLGALLGGGAGLLVALVLAGLWFGGVFKRSPGGSRTPPPGWTLAAGEQFSCFERGLATKVDFNNGSTTRSTPHGGIGRYESWSSRIEGETYQVDSLAYENFKPDTSENGLMLELLALYGQVHETKWNKTISKNVTTVNGQPCLELRWRYNPTWQTELREKMLAENEKPDMKKLRDRVEKQHSPAEVAASKNAAAERVEEHAAHLIVVGDKVFLQVISLRGKPLNEDNVKTFFDSLKIS